MLKTEEIINALEQKQYNVENKKYTKRGISYNYIFIKNNETDSALSIDINDYIYKNPNATLDDMVALIEQMYDEFVTEEKSIDKNYILQNIHIALRKPENDYIVKKNTPFKDVQQYLYMYNDKDSEIVHTPIPYFTLEQYNISEEEAWECALQNNRKTMRILSAKNILEEKNIKNNKANIEVYILTNENMCYGAATVLDTETLKNAFKDAITNKWQVMMLSTHKAILIPKQLDEETRATVEIIKRLEKAELDMKYHLSDNIFPLTL